MQLRVQRITGEIYTFPNTFPQAQRPTLVLSKAHALFSPYFPLHHNFSILFFGTFLRIFGNFFFGNAWIDRETEQLGEKKRWRERVKENG
jgi:hypothetical protein